MKHSVLVSLLPMLCLAACGGDVPLGNPNTNVQGAGGKAGGAGAAGSSATGGASGQGGAGPGHGGTGGAAGRADSGHDDGCSAVRCASGWHCEMKQVQCITTPCNPVATCVRDVPAPTCGGIAAIRCPGAGTCLDIPGDGCDPRAGGADCPATCQCNAIGDCASGAWDSSPSVCACSPAAPTSCAVVLCRAGTHCETTGNSVACIPNAGACVSSADCRLVDNYCDGCTCEARLVGEADPTCNGTTVACFVAPCSRNVAACVNGACIVQ